MFSCLLVLQSPGLTLGEQICLCLYFQHSYVPPNDISLCIVWEVLKCCCSVGLGEFSSGWYQRRRMPQIPGYYGERTTVCFASVVVYWSYGLLPPFLSFALSLASFPHLCFSHSLSVLFCLKQTHICAVRVMVATREGSVLGLYLELWPSRSAVVPAQSTPTENPANPVHHKALVRIFKSLHPLHIWSHLPQPDTDTQLVFNSKHTWPDQMLPLLWHTSLDFINDRIAEMKLQLSCLKETSTVSTHWQPPHTLTDTHTHAQTHRCHPVTSH